MARIRSLKPEFWDDRKLARSTCRDARMLYMGLWGQADEHGRLNGDPLWLKGRIFPYDDDVQPDDVGALLDQLEDAGRVQRYEVDGDPYLFLPKLAKHQRLETAKVAPKYPAPPGNTGDDSPEDFSDDSARDSDDSAPSADESSLSYGAGSKEQVASPRRADETAPSRGGAGDDGFDAFWAGYPRKEAKRKAEQAWRGALKRADRDTIMAGLERFRFPEDRQFIPLPASWLNADRWADQPPPTGGKPSSSLPPWELQ